MTTEQIIGLILTLLVMFAGLAGSILPGLPGTPLVMLAAIGHKLYFGPTGAAWWVLVTLGGLTAISVLVDYAASIYGAKRLGATWRGAAGAIVGALIGLFFSLPGILLGPFVGAMLFELAGGRGMEGSLVRRSGRDAWPAGRCGWQGRLLRGDDWLLHRQRHLPLAGMNR